MTYWILSTDGRTYGPADEATLRRWIAEGRLTPETPVGASPNGPWSEARMVQEVSDLFVTPAAPGVARTGAAEPSAPPTGPGTAAWAAQGAPPGWPPSELAVPLLVSGIFHLVYGVSAFVWSCGLGITTMGLGCCCGVLGVPAFVLGFLEITHYSQRATMDPHRWLDRAKIFAIIDICGILWGNIVAIVCGILVLTQLDGARMRLGGNPR